MRKLYYWPCGTWCDTKELAEYLEFMESNYRVVTVTKLMSEEEIWRMVLSFK
jgi:hypothetical protein